MLSGYFSEVFTSFQGEGVFAGRRHVFLRTAGCNLRCRYCDTPGSLERTKVISVASRGLAGTRTLDNPVSAETLDELLAPFLAPEERVHALAITGGEPLLQADFLAEWLSRADLPVPALLETNGTRPEQLERLRDRISIVSMDLKLPSNSGEPDLFDCHREFLEAIGPAELYVKVPVDEGTSESELETAARLVSEIRPRAPFFIQPILSPEARVTVSFDRLERFYDIARSWLDDVRVLPQAHPFLGIR